MEKGMKCLFYFGVPSMKEDANGHLNGNGAFHDEARIITLLTLKNVLRASKEW